MFELNSYTHLTTKIRVMQGKMLKNEDYEQLLNMDSVADIGQYLKMHTYYKENFINLGDSITHRGELEVMLYRALIKDALKIAGYLRGKEKAIYRFVYRKQEIEDIKKMLRALQMGKDLNELNKRTMFISRNSHIDFDVSLKASNAKELIESLTQTNYHNILKPLLLSDTKINLFAAEMALDLFYYKQLNAEIKKNISGKDADVLTKAFGLDADYRNMMWIYRGKKFYNIRKEILYSYMLPSGYKLKKEQIVDLIEEESADKVLKLLKKGPYGDIIDFDSPHWATSFFKYYGDKQIKNMRLLPFSIAPVVGYIFVKEIEILNLTTIIEGVRYGASQTTMESYLAR